MQRNKSEFKSNAVISVPVVKSIISPKVKKDKSGLSINKAFEIKLEKQAYFAKYLPQLVAQREVAGQEFLRFMAPELTQPMYAYFQDQQNKIGVMSTKLPDFSPTEVPDEKSAALISSQKLALIVVISMLCDETDLKLIHIDANSKIDGDWLFSSLTNSMLKKDADITEQEIAALPYRHKSNVKQWLDMLEEKGAKKSPDKLIFKDLVNDPEFRKAVNEAILRVTLVPDFLLNNFFTSCVLDDKEKGNLKEFILKRRAQLLGAAFKNKSFQDYISKLKNFDELVKMYAKQFSEFKTMSNETLVLDSDRQELVNQIKKKLYSIKQELTLVQNPPKLGQKNLLAGKENQVAERSKHKKSRQR